MFTIVLIDDNETNLALFRSLVQRVDKCTAKVFHDPVEALGWCSENEPDLVITDYMMPQMDGLQFLAAFRAVYPRDSVPVLMVTASDQRNVRYQALVDGANDYLLKPIDNTEFMARVRNMLALRQNYRYMSQRANWLTEEVRKATAEIMLREVETVTRISRAAEFRDPETGAHIQRMAHYSELIAAQMGFSQADQELILAAAPLHDVGKIGIPDAILLKPGKLSDEEFVIMKRHAAYGYDLLNGSASRVVQAGAEIALAHHEKFDGSGYPKGLAGNDIPMMGRIVAVADVFDALTSERPYKKAWPLERAVEFLKEGAGSHFDPACVNAFLSGWDKVLEIRERYQESGDDLCLAPTATH